MLQITLITEYIVATKVQTNIETQVDEVRIYLIHSGIGKKQRNNWEIASIKKNKADWKNKNIEVHFKLSF